MSRPPSNHEQPKKTLPLLPVLCSLFIGLLPLGGHADALTQILQRGSLRVGTTGDYRPFSHLDSRTGHYQGLDIDMARDLANTLGVKLVWVATSWPTMMQDEAQGKFDIAMSGISISLERQKQALFSAPYLNNGKTPITLCKNSQRFQQRSQINQPGVRLVVNPGGTNASFASSHFPLAKQIVHADNNTIFQTIIDEQTDLMVTDAAEARYQQKQHPELCALHPEQPFDFSQKAYLLPNDWRWQAWINQWLNLRLQDGTFQKISQKWLGE